MFIFSALPESLLFIFSHALSDEDLCGGGRGGKIVKKENNCFYFGQTICYGVKTSSFSVGLKKSRENEYKLDFKVNQGRRLHKKWLSVILA